MLISRIKTLFISRFKPLETFFDMDSPLVQSFCEWAGSFSFHHNWPGGLWQHTWETLLIVQFDPRSTPNEFISTFWHDMGKIIEYEKTGMRRREETVNSHVQHSINLLLAHWDIQKYENIDQSIVINEIKAHHGLPSWGALKPAETLGEKILHEADMVSSKIGGMYTSLGFKGGV